jgi:hypothetical protein
MKRRKANRIGHTLCRNCLQRHAVEGKIGEKIEVTGRRVIRSRQQLDDLKEIGRYCKMKQVAVDRTLWRPCFRKGYGLS